MKLYWSAASPYARKCRIHIRERGLADRIEEITIDPFSDPATLIAVNPLGRVPALERPGRPALFDSRVICAFLDSLDGRRRMIPDGQEERLNVLRLEALADGVMDLTVAMSMEKRKPDGEKTPTFAARWRGQLLRGLDAVTAELAQLPAEFSLAHATFASALGYLDYRQPGVDWRSGRPDLAHWFADASKRPSLTDTAPK
jgi:glutathione S-transferase